MTLPLSVVIIARDAAATIGDVISPLRGRVAEVLLVVDAATTDATAEIGRALGARVMVSPWKGFGPMRNWAQSRAQMDWIMMLDADEVPDEDLIAALHRQKWDDPDRVFYLNRLNYYVGSPLRCCGLFPEYRPRIYHRRTGASWSRHHVHEQLVVPREVRKIRLPGLLHHHFVVSIEQHVEKALRYARLRAHDWKEGGRRFNAVRAIMHGFRKFAVLYFLRGGYRAGWRGLAYCSIMASDRLLRHVYLAMLTDSPPPHPQENKAGEGRDTVGPGGA